MAAALTLHAATVARGPQLLVSGANLTLGPGKRVGVVGPNGVGKSTLLAALAGVLPLDSGTRTVAPANATVGWLRQEPVRDNTTVHQLLTERTGVSAAQAELDAATLDLADDAPGAADRYDLALQRWLSLGAADFDARVGEVIAEVGFRAELLERETIALSGGEAARVGLAALLLSRFDIYLLDEPTNDLDLDGLERLEAWVMGLNAGVALVSHDRTFLARTITDVAEIDHHAHTVSEFGGGWQAYLDERQRSHRQAQERYDDYRSQRQALAQRAQRQREWAQQGQAKARRSDERDKFIRHFHTNQTEQLAGKAAQTQRAIDRLEEVESPREPWELHLDIPDAPRSGNIVVRCNAASVDRGRFTLGPVDLMIEYGDRVAITGPNGAGKSTLLGLLTGTIEPTAGAVTCGAGLVVGEIEQTRGQLASASTVLRSFTDATGLEIVEARTLLAKFGLVGPHLERATESLSPGERTRAVLALLMANGANLLVLDEPTNHLDLPAIEQLESALDTFAGTVLVVSHDRTFLDAFHPTRTLHVANGTVTA